MASLVRVSGDLWINPDEVSSVYRTHGYSENKRLLVRMNNGVVHDLGSDITMEDFLRRYSGGSYTDWMGGS